jgi:glucokinase
MSTKLLAGDVGATKTDLAIFSSEDGPRTPLVESTLSTTNYPTFESLVGEFLAQAQQRVDRAVFAGAGPVIDGRVTATISHLSWELDQNQVQQAYDHVSYELVCSGMGIPHIYAFLKESGYATEPAWLSEQLATVEDPTPVIVNTALDQETLCEICTATLRHFISILGAEAGNLALKVMATGGVYLGGGIPPRILPVLEREKERFLNAFWNKGIMTEMLVDVPVHVIVNPQAALLGAACRALL